MPAEFLFPKVLAWEVTRRCPMKCRHCRAAAADLAYADELSTDECRAVIDSLAAGRPPMIIWTGGEPMTRDDLPELVAHATSRGIRSVMAPCGLLVTEARLRALKDAGIRACSFSIDGPDAAAHDAFRGVPGAFERVCSAIDVARRIGLPFQINTTVSRLNVERLDEIRALAVELGASRLDLFFLVTVGRGRALAPLALDDVQTRRVLDWMAAGGELPMKATCCPSGPTGCLGGRGFAFLSHVGTLQTCGFIEAPCGSIREHGLDFRELVAAAANPLGECGNCRTHHDKFTLPEAAQK